MFQTGQHQADRGSHGEEEARLRAGDDSAGGAPMLGNNCPKRGFSPPPQHGKAFAGSIAMELSAKPTFDPCNEVSLGQLSAFDRIEITTRNHTYEVVVTSPDTGEVLVRGGTVFPQFTAARLNGSTAGGHVIDGRRVNVGVRVEFAIEGYTPVVTSRVQTLAVAHH